MAVALAHSTHPEYFKLTFKQAAPGISLEANETTEPEEAVADVSTIQASTTAGVLLASAAYLTYPVLQTHNPEVASGALFTF